MAQTAPVKSTKEWISVHEASALIGVSAATLRRWSDAGDIRTFTTPGGHRRFSRSAILGLLPATRRQRPNLERMGETPEHMIRVYRRHLADTCFGVPWLGELEDAELTSFREQGRLIARSLIDVIDAATPEAHVMAIEQATGVAAEFGRMAARCRVDARHTVEAFLVFRLPFLRELASVARRRGLDTGEATELLETATEAIDLLISALMIGHESADAAAVPLAVTAE